jgi:hypothetical protein
MGRTEKYGNRNLMNLLRTPTIIKGYTAHTSLSQRRKMLGNGWTIDVIAGLLNGLKAEPKQTTRGVI